MDLALNFGAEASYFELLDASTGEAFDALLDSAGSFALSPRSKWSHHIILVQIFVAECFFFHPKIFARPCICWLGKVIVCLAAKQTRDRFR